MASSSPQTKQPVYCFPIFTRLFSQAARLASEILVKEAALDITLIKFEPHSLDNTAAVIKAFPSAQTKELARAQPTLESVASDRRFMSVGPCEGLKFRPLGIGEGGGWKWDLVIPGLCPAPKSSARRWLPSGMGNQRNCDGMPRGGVRGLHSPKVCPRAETLQEAALLLAGATLALGLRCMLPTAVPCQPLSSSEGLGNLGLGLPGPRGASGCMGPEWGGWDLREARVVLAITGKSREGLRKPLGEKSTQDMSEVVGEGGEQAKEGGQGNGKEVGGE